MPATTPDLRLAMAIGLLADPGLSDADARLGALILLRRVAAADHSTRKDA